MIDSKQLVELGAECPGCGKTFSRRLDRGQAILAEIPNARKKHENPKGKKIEADLP
jgi:hypothetical protein